MLSPSDMPAGYRLAISEADTLDIRDETDAALHLSADIEQGELSFKLRAKHKNTGVRGTVRGKVLFNLMMRHFGDRIKAVRCCWIEETNLEDVNRLTASGMKEEDAAENTWSGKQLAGYGFGFGELLDKIGGPGAFALFKVRFIRR